MTTREKVERLLDRLSEAELEAEHARLQVAIERSPDTAEWDDLDRFSAGGSLGVLRHMEEEEAKAGFSWEKYR